MEIESSSLNMADTKNIIKNNLKTYTKSWLTEQEQAIPVN